MNALHGSHGSLKVISDSLTGARIGRHILETGEFVPAAGATARRVPRRALESPTVLLNLYRTHNRLHNLSERCLPLEADFRRSVDIRLEAVGRTISWFEHDQEMNLPVIDPTFLSWKTANGFPGFSIFRLDDSRTIIKFVANQRSKKAGASVHPRLPDLLTRHYINAGLLTNLGAYCKGQRFEQMELTAQYRGAMPEWVREKIHIGLEAKTETGQPLFEDIVIVAEAPQESWQVTGIPEKDPLVIGIAHGLTWLIAAYDLTPAEEAARKLYAGFHRDRVLN